jgi:hypothetical protein
VHSAGVECVALRYGFFYGLGTWYAGEGDMGEQLRRRQVPVIGAGQGVWRASCTLRMPPQQRSLR